MNRNLIMLLCICIMLLFSYSCTVSIDGAPCDPKLNNCPSGQYCSSEGICKRGKAELGDISIPNDIFNSDVETKGDISDILVEPIQDIISSDVEDGGPDDVLDGGCKDECQTDMCKDDNTLLVCKDWNGGGCKEYREVECGINLRCVNDKCICTRPYMDCNDNMSDGCETNTDTNPEKCGSCSNDCGQNSVCNNGICGCVEGFENCNGEWSDGCEINIKSDSKNCGECNKTCGGNSYCSNKNCVCNKGFGDCNKDAPGCETNIDMDINHCGECNKVCNPQNVNSVKCTGGKCGYDKCLDYFIDNDSKKENGCEYWTNYPKRYDNFGSKDEPVFVLFDDDGIIIGGNTTNNQLWLLKADKFGEIVWQKIIQLQGIAKFRRGIRVVNEQGLLEGYLLVGTLQNANKIDIFAIKIDKKGTILFAKSYYRQGFVNVFDVADAVYIPLEKKYILVGSTDKTPLLLSINEDGTLDFAKYYMEQGTVDSPIGKFTGVKSFPDPKAVYITGIYSKLTVKNSIFVIKLESDGEIIRYNRIYSKANEDLAGLSLVPAPSLISSEDFIIVGYNGSRGQDGSGIVIQYNFLNNQIGNSFTFSGKDSTDSSVGLVFNSIIPNDSGGMGYFIGGTAFFRDNITIKYQALLATADLNSNKITMKTVKVNGGEEVVDMFFNNNSLFFISPVNTTSLDMMVVKLNSNLEVENSVCDRSFINSLTYIPSSLMNLSLAQDIVKVDAFNDIKSRDALNSIKDVGGNAYNICNKPYNP